MNSNIIIDNKVLANESGHCEPDLNLLDLPHVVLDLVLEYMDDIALKTLRSVSRVMKSLVETPKIIQNIRITISDPTRLDDVNNSEVEWNNIWITIGPKWCLDTTEVTQFLQSKRNTLAHLSLTLNRYTDDPNQLFNFLVNVGPNLKQLLIDGPLTFQSEDQEKSITEYKIKLDESREILERNFSGLRLVKFTSDKFGYGHGHGALNYLIDTFLKCCSESININIPMMARSPYVNPLQLSDEEKEVKCAPLISYLERLSELKGIRPLSKIDFWGGSTSSYNHDIYDYVPHFPLTPSILTKLVMLCERNRVKLFNVPSSALPETIVLTSNEKKCFDKCIGSILCLNDPIGVRGYIPASCPVRVKVSYWKDFSSFNIPDTANVISIYIDGTFRGDTFNSNINPGIMLRNLLQVFRPNVSVLIMQTCFLEGVELKFGQFLPNLTRLALIFLYWEREIKDLLNGLNKLQYFIMKECEFKNSTGPRTDHWFPKLKSLKHIQMEECSFDMKLIPTDRDRKETTR